MNTSFKKIMAGVTAVTIVAMNMAVVNAASVGTVTGGQNAPQVINSTWTSGNPNGTTASGSDTIAVSALVAPILTMDISTNALSLGTLSTSAYADQSVSVTTATNAVGGVNVTMGSAGLKDSVIDREIGVTDIATATNTAATDRYLFAVGSAIGVGSADMIASQSVLAGTNVTDSNDTKVVHVGAIIGSTTEAGNYSDTLTFSVTGTF